MEKKIEIIHKEIDLIQACIKKYDDRTLLIRGWSVGLIALICGLTTTDIIFFNPDAKPVSLSLLLVVNGIFRLIDIDNSKKKWQYTQLYNWVINNRSFDDNKPWAHVYDLNYKRFSKSLVHFEYSDFGKKLYVAIWGFILMLMIYYTVESLTKKTNSKKEVPSVIINKNDSTGKK